MLNYMTLNHDQVFSLTSMSPFGMSNDVNDLSRQIIMSVAVARLGDEDKLVKKINSMIEERTRVSFGKMLEKLSSVANLGPELDGDHDGLDALCYHLSGNCCEKGIAALHKVLNRFEQMKRAKAVLKLDTSKANVQEFQDDILKSIPSFPAHYLVAIRREDITPLIQSIFDKHKITLTEVEG